MGTLLLLLYKALTKCKSKYLFCKFATIHSISHCYHHNPHTHLTSSLNPINRPPHFHFNVLSNYIYRVAGDIKICIFFHMNMEVEFIECYTKYKLRFFRVVDNSKFVKILIQRCILLLFLFNIWSILVKRPI